MQNIIKCPHCGCEYLPAEIYYPDAFLGKPDDIVRDDEGHIEFFSGENMDLHEEFCCTNCGCSFDVDAQVKFVCTLTSEPENDEDCYIVDLK